MITEVLTYDTESGWSDADLKDAPTTLILMFSPAAAEVRSDALAALRARFPSANISGCSGLGQITNCELSEVCIAASVTQFESSALRSAHLEESSDGAIARGRRLGEKLTGNHLRAVLMFATDPTAIGTEFMGALQETLGVDVAVGGGIAGGSFAGLKSHVLVDGEVREGVAAVGIYGEGLRAATAVGAGWDRFGPDRRITRADGNTIFEFDGRPALAVYQRYLGDLAAELPASGSFFPLAVSTSSDFQRHFIRAVRDVDEEAGSVTFYGDTPEGMIGTMMKGNLNQLAYGGADAAEELVRARVVTPGLVVCVSCYGRRIVMEDAIEEELEAVSEVLPDGTPVIGFYAEGEIATGARCGAAFHNQTVVLIGISET